MNPIFIDQKFEVVVRNAEHFLALEWDVVEIDADDELPWDLVNAVTLSGATVGDLPFYCYAMAPHPCGVTMKWTIPLLHNKDPNYGKVDHASIAKAMSRLPAAARDCFADLIATHILPAAKRRVTEASAYLEIANANFGIIKSIAENAEVCKYLDHLNMWLHSTDDVAALSLMWTGDKDVRHRMGISDEQTMAIRDCVMIPRVENLSR